MKESKEHSNEKVCEIFASQYSLGIKEGPLSYFYFFKSSLETLLFFKIQILLYKIGLLSFNKKAVTRKQFLQEFTRRIISRIF
jgi:hypothetical protein